MRDPSARFSQDIQDLIGQFTDLQEERVRTYRIFEEGNKDYLNSGPDYDFVSYRQVVHDVTQEFKEISDKILDIETRLREKNTIEIADIISAIQECEGRKLELTVQHQLTRQMVADSDGNDLELNKEREIRQQIAEVIDDINDNLTDLRYARYDE